MNNPLYKKELDQKYAAGAARVRDAVSVLREHFDTVQIFVTAHGNDEIGTYAYDFGSGHWHARLGHITEWMDGTAYVRAAQRQDRDDQGDDE